MKIRQNIYFDPELNNALDALATAPGTNKSRMVNDAVAAWLARRASREVDDLFKLRLDRLSREIGHARRDLAVLLESLSLFVLHQLTTTAPFPEADAAARSIGRDRFEKFITEVSRQIAAGQRLSAAPETGDLA